MTPPLVEVHLVGIPVQLHAAAAEHADGLRREFALLRAAGSPRSDLPARLQELADQLTDRFGGFNDAAEDRLALARERGEPTLDLTFQLPADAAEGARQLNEMFDAADEFCRSGEHLLSLVAPPEVADYRRWFLDEFAGQLRGASPTPWVEHAGREADHAIDVRTTNGHASVPSTSEATMRVAADIDIGSAPALRADLHGMLATRPQRLVLDLSMVPFVDSVGIGVILAALRRMSEWDGELVVMPSPTVRRTFEIAGLASVLAAPDRQSG